MKFSSIFSIATLAVSALAAPFVEADTKAVRASAPASVDDIVTLFSGSSESITSKTTQIDTILKQVQSGETPQSEANPQVLDLVQGINLDLSAIVNSLTTSAGIPVQEGDVDRLLTVVNALLTVVLANVRAIVTVLGLQPQLVSILRSVVILVSNIVTLLTGLVAGLLPGLIAALSPLLAGLGNGVLAPILTPLAALLAGLAGP
ncbi:hypothetical protein V2G26_001296 [Clonostachys chloroleuca]|uniref:Uncharacterized protein n=1 Tax=Clonostachys chloroleuca TaxID=1926264 RepID=A0AA35QAW8_9HYPO|nr:unnamed protein product [Clonostachys chloroleuca]